MSKSFGIQQSIDAEVLSPHCPLSYVGGKRWFANKIKDIIKASNLDNRILVSPFCGGASAEIAVAATGMKVIACDRYDILINFYNQFQKNPSEICQRVVEYYPINPDRQYLIDYAWEIWEKLSTPGIKNDDEIAALTWFVNKNSWRGVTFFRPPQIRPNTNAEFFTELKWLYWQNRNLIFEMSDYKETLEKYDNDKYVFYLDPPYLHREFLYNHYRRDITDMDHLWMRDWLIETKTPFILSHDWTPEISEMYATMNQMQFSRTHGFNNVVKKVTELVITNF